MKYKEEMAEAYNLILQASKKEIQVEADFYNTHVQGCLRVRNLDRLILEDAKVMEDIPMEEGGGGGKGKGGNGDSDY